MARNSDGSRRHPRPKRDFWVEKEYQPPAGYLLKRDPFCVTCMGSARLKCERCGFDVCRSCAEDGLHDEHKKDVHAQPSTPRPSPTGDGR